MTNAQLHRALARIVRDLNNVSDEIFDRAIESEHETCSRAQTAVGQLCMVFLDSKQLAPLVTMGLEGVYRRIPYSTTDANYITIEDRVDEEGQAAERLCARVLSIKTGKAVKKGKRTA